ncbi:SDR family NAD(P)-dependent oxidoreductase [Aeromicrobium sp. YIM 150415]|uniref:SDR family NAD(P)-dependent oxidoreductase n=1 Tax=Aeromicrobium sp. YIM 150415 TaxID=2803912 RepID=UPI001963D38F|nr:SDR family NAD(P)-dependent oxidoreductase [Aeromicrobium sp. YIM 150415]MBM9465171.1 SDR family NAD(P)-dependent oxidoreductase [Aeromicrobium sp. YIM 150415]
MSERTIVITGGSDGIGAEAARQVRRSQASARIVLVGRSPEKTTAVAREIGADHCVADYTRLDDVRRVAAEIRSTVDRIDVLANNAGGVFGERAVTEDGNEKTFQVNLLAPFLLTHLLLDPLRAGEGGVINTSSASARIVGKVDIEDLNHEKRYAPMRAYGDAKLANILFALGLDRHHRVQGIRAAAFDPGNVRTSFGAENNDFLTRLLYRTPLSKLALIAPEKGGANLAFFLNGRPGVDWQAGRFYAQTKPASRRQTNKQAFDEGLIEEFWRRVHGLLGIAEG